MVSLVRFEGSDGSFMWVETTHAAEGSRYQALGVRAGADAARRRTQNDAGARVCAVDRSFIAEAHGGAAWTAS